jgi:hypothetical protein
VDVEEFAAVGAASDWGVFDQREVEVVVGRDAKGVSPQRAKVSLIGAGSSGQVDWDREQKPIVRAAAEVVFADFAGGRELRDADLVGAVDSCYRELSLSLLYAHPSSSLISK